MIVLLIRANFKISKDGKNETNTHVENTKKDDLTKSEFEEFMMKSGSAGSFMVFRSKKKEEELGLEEL